MPRLLLRSVAGLCAFALCACAAGPPTASPAPVRPPTLRLVSIRPEVGARVDSLTVIEATLVYDVPGFGRGSTYWVTPTFVGTNGIAFSRPPQTRVRLDVPTGAVTIRYPLLELLRDRRLVTPLTGQFFLLESTDAPADTVVRDTVIAGEQRRIRVRSAGTVRARSRSFFYNGGGPASERRGQSSLADALEEYFTFSSRKAFAVARDSAGRWVSGYAVDYTRRDSAVARALRECGDRLARRALAAECEIVALDNVAVAPGEPLPPDSTGERRSPLTPERIVRPVPIRVPPGALLIDSIATDVDADGVAEHIALYAEVEVDAAGRPLWEDAHRWLLLVRDGSESYPLVSALVPFGHTRFTVVAADADQPPRIVVERRGGNGITVESFRWDASRGGYAGRALSVPGRTIFRSREVR